MFIYYKLWRVTWWTRHSAPEPELTDDEDEDEPEPTQPNQMAVEAPQQHKDEGAYCDKKIFSLVTFVLSV